VDITDNIGDTFYDDNSTEEEEANNNTADDTEGLYDIDLNTVESDNVKNPGDNDTTYSHIWQDESEGNLPNTVANDSMKGTHSSINETLVTLNTGANGAILTASSITVAPATFECDVGKLLHNGIRKYTKS